MCFRREWQRKLRKAQMGAKSEGASDCEVNGWRWQGSTLQVRLEQLLEKYTGVFGSLLELLLEQHELRPSGIVAYFILR